MLASTLRQRLLDMIARSQQRNIPLCTDFLDPASQADAHSLCKARRVHCQLEGGHPAAERRILCLLPHEEQTVDTSKLLFAFSVESAKPLQHPDLLGALLALGVKRDTVGDLCIGRDEAGRGQATVYCLAHVGPLLLSLSQVGRQSVCCAALPLGGAPAQEHDGRMMQGSVSSLRLDSLLALAFRLPRGKAAALIEAGGVRLNWKECRDRGKALQPGDTISAHRHGRAVLLALEGQSRKGRQMVSLEVYGS